MSINVIEGKVVAKPGMKVGIVASRFNSFIVSKLLEGAVDGLVRHGVEESNITACWVPGAFEIPVVAQKMAEKDYDAIIAVGAKVFQGERNDNLIVSGAYDCASMGEDMELWVYLC